MVHTNGHYRPTAMTLGAVPRIQEQQPCWPRRLCRPAAILAEIHRISGGALHAWFRGPHVGRVKPAPCPELHLTMAGRSPANSAPEACALVAPCSPGERGCGRQEQPNPPSSEKGERLGPLGTSTAAPHRCVGEVAVAYPCDQMGEPLGATLLPTTQVPWITHSRHSPTGSLSARGRSVD